MSWQRTPNGLVVEIFNDGRTVWINAPESAIGRFSPFGIDVHRRITAENNESECLACTHGVTGLPEWRQFQALMLEHYGVTVSDQHMPIALKG